MAKKIVWRTVRVGKGFPRLPQKWYGRGSSPFTRIPRSRHSVVSRHDYWGMMRRLGDENPAAAPARNGYVQLPNHKKA